VFKGVCKGKTQILATHAVDFLEHCDAIAIMHKGQIVAFGTFEELHKNDYF
jgi:ABC-type multidrug transport system fused ATPase/permease subunit